MRDLGIDFIRVTACFMVVILHVACDNFYSFNQMWWATNFYDSSVRCSVPLFLMISGSLLLTKQESYLLFYKRRLIRIILPLVFWSIFYMLTNNIFNNISYGNMMQWVKSIIKGPVIYHFWYLYNIIGIYLFVPFLKKIYITSTMLEKIVYIILWIIISSIWPTLQVLLGVNFDLIGVYALNSFCGLIGYLFLGAYLFEYNKNTCFNYLHLLTYFFILLLSNTLTMLATFYISKKMGSPNELFYNYLAPFVLVSAICAFNILYNIGLKLKKYIKIIRLLAESTMGIYCIHVFIINRLAVSAKISIFIGSLWWSIPIISMLVFIISFVIILVLRRNKIGIFIT